MEESITISDESQFQEKTPSLKEICLRHISKISTICCQEFSGGYWQEKPIKIGGGMVVTKVYHPDIREAYCNAVDFLYDLVYPLADKAFQDITVEDNSAFKEDIWKKVEAKRKIFKEINVMFNRTNFFSGMESYEE